MQICQREHNGTPSRFHALRLNTGRRGEQAMNDAGGWMWLVIDVIFVLALAFALIYGTMQWRARRRNPLQKQATEDATRRLYERGAENERRGNA
jgi:flagellar biosynthesis/type III secretory pathway M-ring protein FliF/YscJ